MLILFTKNKELIITQKTKLYWRETGVDLLKILVPETYMDVPLVDFTFSLSFVDPANQAHLEVLDLVKDVDLETPVLYSSNYEDESLPRYLQYVLPVDTEITKMVGNISIQLSGTWYDNDNMKQYVIHSNTLGITIDSFEDYMALVPDSALSSIDNRIMELNNSINALYNLRNSMMAKIPDDIGLDKETSRIHLSIDGELQGDGVEIVQNVSDIDGTPDGIIDLDSDNIDPDGDVEEQVTTVPLIDLGS